MNHIGLQDDLAFESLRPNAFTVWAQPLDLHKIDMHTI